MVEHRRQYVLGPETVDVDASWTSVEVAPRLWLSHSRDVPVTHEGATVVVGDRLGGGAGRYVQITRDAVDLDPAGTLACYHRTIAGQVWCSSSVALLAGLPPARRPALGAIRHAAGMDYYPPPATRFPGVRQLLPTQRLDPTTGEVSARPRFTDVGEDDYEEVLGRLERRLVELVRAVAELGEPWLPLTGGYDSRLILAAATAAGVPVRTYTNTILFAPMSAADREIPRRLVRALDLPPHTDIAPRGFDPALVELFERHTAGQWAGADSMFIAAHQWDQLPSDAVVLRGGVFELGRCFYWHALPPLDRRASAQEISDAVRTGLGLDAAHPDSEPHREGVSAWARWLVDHPEPVDWRDRFYFDVRVGGWLAANEQALDLVRPRRIHVANDLGVLNDLLCVPVEHRRASRHHVDLIRRMAPAIADVPFNPPDTQRSRLVHRLRREAYAARHLLGVRAYARDRTGKVGAGLRHEAAARGRMGTRRYARNRAGRAVGLLRSLR